MRRLFFFCLLFSSLYAEPVALITGGTRGIGLATAEMLAQKGYHVYATGRQCPAMSIDSLHFIKMDVTDEASVQAAVAHILKKEGRLDLLINNAGYALGGALETLQIEEIKQQMEVNFYGPIRVCQAVLPQMRKQKRGQIINISSEQGVYGLPYGSLYTASKAALESMTEALSIEVMPWNIRVSIVEPGYVISRFTIVMGTRTLEGGPYQAVTDQMQQALKDRLEHPESITPYQTPSEVAAVLYDIILDAKPQLRYQTSEQARKMVGMKLSDLNGREYSRQMKRLFESGK